MGKKIITLLIGIACIVIGIFVLVSFLNAQKTQTAETTAKIIKIDSEMQMDSDGYETRWYYPVVEYIVNNQNYEARLPDSGTTNSAQYKEEDTVSIKYNPNKPQEISSKGSIGGLIGGIAFIVFGVIALVVSIIDFIKNR